ncbi:putative bifunctional diguanylate cyclase/phosphodiesterase [Aliiruegeria sabulilitoris]|uniref:putative bifunctional diguanylate cyclase/phosphodiesterase n=1 Tax=Aliiruegeria sabulilitoris TaxID=1510458 RepID=UPI00082C8C48|nr:EAL domain-containing protein [Aliiruegeria sabulilitoris]NDR59102.1 EAL domain-containing protein [Pseudoruegeria sp. M32A2M]
MNLRVYKAFSDRARMATSGLGRRLSYVFGALITAIVAAVILINVQTQLQLVRERLELRLLHLLEIATEVSLPYLIEGRAAELDIIFEELRNQPDLIDIFIIDQDGIMVVESEEQDDIDFLKPANDPLAERAAETSEIQRLDLPEIRKVAKPLMIGNVNYGTLRLDFDPRGVRSEIAKVWSRNALGGVLFVLVGLFTSNIVAIRLVGPLNRLTHATERAANGDLDQSICVRTNDEIERLASSFNTMLVALRRSIQEIHEVAYRDKLTGVPNRAWLGQQLEQIAIEASAKEERFSVLFLDLDDFKSVNDNHGHHVGDQLLVLFAHRLRCCVSEIGLSALNVGSDRNAAKYRFDGDAVVARLGGDEFTIIVPSILCRELVERIIEAMQSEFVLEDLGLRATTSIGVANFPEHAPNSELLLKHADVAMYQAKRAGRNTFAFYDGDQHKLTIERLELAAEIRGAVEQDQFIIFLQPQFLVATGQVSGAEALVRWNHPTRGILCPDMFLPVAAGAGLLPEIGRLVVRKTLKAAFEILPCVSVPLTFAVNLSVDELADEAFVEELLWQIDGANLPRGTIEIEITENTAMTDGAAIERQLERLRLVGTRLAIDDFGVGYSNLGRLKGLAFDTLKLDRSLLQDVGEDEEAENLMATILAMAQVMKADVVAEGIETRTQLSVLEKYHCRHYQGYLGARPMPVDRFEKWLRANLANREYQA